VSEPDLIVIAGPTGSGKSDLGILLAQQFNGEIVNCDSVQLYRYMDIGTAKTPVSERRGIPHHLIDILNPDEVFTAGDYQRLGRTVLKEIAGRGRVPVVVGGTGFYLRALISGLFRGPGRDESLRARLSARNPGSLHRLLTRFDPESARRIHANDTQKLIRALEVCLLSRVPVSTLHAQSEEPLLGFRILRIGLDPPRQELTERIHERCERMFQAGLVDEVKRILAMGFPAESKALESIGYRESLLHIRGELTVQQAITATQIATRQYAKRQRTWFRREPSFNWLRQFGNQPQTFEEAKRLVTFFQANKQ
jgi:tRNA dimethylallyltransferase